MSVLKGILTLSAALTAMVMPVLAATEEREPPGELAVWIFLGFCALIVVAQLAPMVRQVWHRLAEQKNRRIEATEDAPEN